MKKNFVLCEPETEALKLPVLVELNHVIDERESTVKCLMSNVPGNIADSTHQSFVEMLTILGIAQVELDYLGEKNYEVLTESIQVIRGNLSFSTEKHANTIGYDVFLMNATNEVEALAFKQLKEVISDVITFFDAEKILREVFGLVKELRDDPEVITTIKNGTFYTDNKPFKCFVDLALEVDEWDETKTTELYLSC